MNLPNKITLTRILMIPVFVLVFFLEDVLPYNYIIAAALFVIASCTDFIDGHIARSRNLVTNLGKFLDPIADKVLVSTAMLLLLTMQMPLFAKLGTAAEGIYIAVAVSTCIIMARELIISAFRQIAAARGFIMAAEKLGKYKTACQDVALCVLFFAADVNGMVGKIITCFGLALFAIATILTIWSGISYVVKHKQVLKDN